jgi:ABC-type dipeptide/oligopeptide/nickel transport system permease component
MARYLLRRILFLLLTLLVTSLIIFAITQLLPGDVCRVILGREVGEAALSACRERLGLDDPAVTRSICAGWATSSRGIGASPLAPVRRSGRSSSSG